MLRYSKKRLEEESAVTDIFFKAQAELESRKKLYKRFRRKLTDEELASSTDEDIKVPLERYISVMSAGYFGGKPPIYKVKAYNEDRNTIIETLFDKKTNTEQDINEIEELIRHIIDYNDDPSHFLKMVLDFLVKRACYEIYYKDENTGEITISRADALETVAIWDYSLPKNLIGLYRIIQTTMANGEYQNMVELTTAKGKKYYMDTPDKRKLFATPEFYKAKYGNENLFVEDESQTQPQKWDDIPAMAIEQDDGIAIFEPIISLIEAYQRCIQNSRNVFKYNDEAILVVKGYNPENPTTIVNEEGIEVINPARELEDKYVLESRVRYVDRDEGDIYWVEKNVNDTAVQNHKKTLMDIICLCSFCPNMTDLGFTSADNNSALEKKFFSLQQYIATFEGEFKKGLLRRWEIILNKFNKEKGKNYDFRDIQIFLQRNVPTDKGTETDRWLKLRGLLSDETVISNLPDDLDSQSEIDKMNEQNEIAMQQNLENMKQLGQEGDNSNFEDDEEDENNNNKDTAESTDKTNKNIAEKGNSLNNVENKDDKNKSRGDVNVGKARGVDEKAKNNIQQGKQANTKSPTRNI